jgi:hypothetical protein
MPMVHRLVLMRNAAILCTLLEALACPVEYMDLCIPFRGGALFGRLDETNPRIPDLDEIFDWQICLLYARLRNAFKATSLAVSQIHLLLPGAFPRFRLNHKLVHENVVELQDIMIYNDNDIHIYIYIHNRLVRI